MPMKNQLHVKREDVQAEREALLKVHEGDKTEAGFRENIRVGVQSIEAWLRGRGAVPLYNLMEDAATAEISRAQIWQWLHHDADLDDGPTVTPDLFRQGMDDELARARAASGPGTYDKGRFPEAESVCAVMSLARDFEEFLTLPACRLLG